MVSILLTLTGTAAPICAAAAHSYAAARPLLAALPRNVSVLLAAAHVPEE